MKGTILEKIIDAKRVHVEAAKRTADMSRLVEDAQDVRTKAQSHRLREALSDRSRINLIAEFKRASPSKGVINDSLDPVMAAI
ncbi:MAG: indole-3-glycerol phosphate synthase TrpC, partial [Candidatus Binatia bacterium]